MAGEETAKTPGAVAVVGASGPLGRRVVAELAAAGRAVLALARDPAQLQGAALASATRRVLDLERCERAGLNAALEGADVVASCTYAHFVPAIADALPASVRRFVMVGSTRRYVQVPDRIGEDVRRAEERALGLPIESLVLHPTMIYGAESDATLSRILALVRRFPVIPVPGGRARVQPVFIDDVARAVATAATAPGPLPSRSLVVAGPEAVTPAELVRACARALGRRCLPLPLPLPLLGALAWGLRDFAGYPEISWDELKRVREARAFDTCELAQILGVTPLSLEEGLARALGSPPSPR